MAQRDADGGTQANYRRSRPRRYPCRLVAAVSCALFAGHGEYGYHDPYSHEKTQTRGVDLSHCVASERRLPSSRFPCACHSPCVSPKWTGQLWAGGWQSWIVSLDSMPCPSQKGHNPPCPPSRIVSLRFAPLLAPPPCGSPSGAGESDGTTPPPQGKKEGKDSDGAFGGSEPGASRCDSSAHRGGG